MQDSRGQMILPHTWTETLYFSTSTKKSHLPNFTQVTCGKSKITFDKLLSDLSSSTNCLEASDWGTIRLIIEGDADMFSSRRYNYRSGGRTSMSSDCRVFKARVATSMDPGSDCQTIGSKTWLTRALQIYRSHKPCHIYAPAGLFTLKGTCAQFATEEAKRLLRGTQGWPVHFTNLNPLLTPFLIISFAFP